MNLCRRRVENPGASPLEHYKVNETIRECCQGFQTAGNKCIPMCRNNCVNSHCIGNNQCRCNVGYVQADHFRCRPQCDPECGSAMACLAPNLCVCKADYKRLNASHCEPICAFTADSFECINAKCVAPNECECFDGFRRVSNFQCEPICERCENGECVSPGVCECLEGYEKDSDGSCAPICDPPCVNGKCVAPDSCLCDENFEKYWRNHECLEKHVIKDHQSCMKSCRGGACSENGTCVCHPGYEMYNGKCSKVCDKECANGKCLEDRCVCPEDYKLSENATSCLPICAFEESHDCIYGTCVAPQTCKCFDGYQFLDSRNCTCIPMCSPQCINGVCTEDGCICHENFYALSSYECIKNCSEGSKWVYDECMEDIFSLESNETDSDESVFDDKNATELFTSYEDESSSTSASTALAVDERFDDEDEGSSGDDTTQLPDRWLR